MDHDKRKLWIFMLNSLRPKKIQDSETALIERLGCIRSAARVVSVPPEDPVFRGQAVLCLARALVAEQDREPLEALEQSFRDILAQSAKPELARFMSQKLQAIWGIAPLLHEMGPNFADTCHRALLTSSRPEPLISGVLLRASLQLLKAGIRPSSGAMVRSLALRAKLACGAGDLTEDEVKEKDAAVRVLAEMLQAPAGSMPEDLCDSILEFINDDEVFEEPCVAPSLRRVDLSLCHKAYDCCLQHFHGSHFKTRRLNLLTLLAVKMPVLRSKHVKLLQGRLNDGPVDCLQGLRHLRRLLKVGLPKEDVQQVFKRSFQLLRSELKGSRYFATAAQLCADTTASFLQPRKRKDRADQALFPTSKRRKFERQGVVTVEGLQPFLATPSSNAFEWMALSSFALEVCRLHADQAPERIQEGLSMKFFHEIHGWLLRSFKERTQTSGRQGKGKTRRAKYGPWLRRSSKVLRYLFRHWAPCRDEVKQLLHMVLCQDGKATAKELRWRFCILEAAAHEVPGILALLRWPDLTRPEAVRDPRDPSVKAGNTWAPFPNELSAFALVWWQALFTLIGTPKSDHMVRPAALSKRFLRTQVLTRFRRYARSSNLLKRGRHLLPRLAVFAAKNGLQEDACRILERCVSHGARKKRVERLLSFAALESLAPDTKEGRGCSLMERVRHAFLPVQAVARFGLRGAQMLSPVIEDLDQFASNPLFPAASRAALRSWKFFAEMLRSHGQSRRMPELTPKIERACSEASNLALARLKDLRSFEVGLALELMPLPGCLFGAYGGLEVKVTPRQLVYKRSRYRELIIEGEPILLGRVRRSHAKAIHAAWHSTDIVVIHHWGQVEFTVPRRFALITGQPPLAFHSRMHLKSAAQTAGCNDQTQAKGSRNPSVNLQVTLRTSLGIVLAYGEAAVPPPEEIDDGQGPPEVPEAPRRETRPPREASPGESFSDSPVEMLPEQPESPAIDSESE